MRTVYVEAAKPYRVAFMHQVLSPGRYVLIPFLEEPLSTAAYLLRLYLPRQTASKQVHPVPRAFSLLSLFVQNVTDFFQFSAWFLPSQSERCPISDHG